MMRLFVLTALPAILLGQSGVVVEGRVTNQVTHAGIEGIEVALQNTASRNGPSYTGTTDGAGGFRIEGVPDGEYRASFGKPGFLPANHLFRVSSPVGTVQLQLELAAMPRLHGRVVDADGHPVSGAVIQLVHLGGGGRPNATSGKDGAFDFEEMLPSTFVIRAIPPRGLEPPRLAADEIGIWAATYYPDVTEQFRAERISLRPGDERECEIKLRAVPVFHVRGLVVDEEDRPVPGASVKLLSPDSLDARSHATFESPEGQTTAAEDGAFEFAAVRSGEWYLLASGKRGERSLSGVVTGTVSKSDWENVKIQLVVPFTVRGIVERDGPSSTRHTWVGLIPAWQIRLMGIHNETGAFEIDGVVPGKYRILLEEPLPGSYVDSIQYGGRDVMGQTVDVMDASLPIRVVYKTNGGRVQGSVENGGGAIVVLLPKEPALQNSEFMRWGWCNGSGRFDIGSLRPGAYYAAAFERMDLFDLSYGLYYGGVVDRALIDAIAGRGVSVRVESGQSATVTLKLMAWPEQ
jgi:hypothetical protein